MKQKSMLFSTTCLSVHIKYELNWLNLTSKPSRLSEQLIVSTTRCSDHFFWFEQGPKQSNLFAVLSLKNYDFLSLGSGYDAFFFPKSTKKVPLVKMIEGAETKRCITI